MKYKYLNIKTNRYDHLISLLISFVFLGPPMTFFYLSIPVLILMMYDGKSRNYSQTIPIIFCVIVSFMLNINQPYIDFKVISRIVTYVIILLTFARLKPGRILFPYIMFTLCFILLSQICVMLNVPLLRNFFDNVYDVTGFMESRHHNDMGNLTLASVNVGARYGGIYGLSNECARFVCLLYALGLCTIYQLKKNNIGYIFTALVFFSLMLTGSRTSLIVFVAMSLYFFYSKGRNIKTFLIIGVLISIMSLFFKLGETRFVKIEEGMDDSFSIKTELFFTYIINCDNPIHMLFGGGDLAVSSLYNIWEGGTDFELGNIYIVYGIVGYFAFFIFYYRMYKSLTKEKRIILLVLLWAFSNGIFLNFRMCPLWMISIGILFRESIAEKRIPVLKR